MNYSKFDYQGKRPDQYESSAKSAIISIVIMGVIVIGEVIYTWLI
jgi:hypothetical protein